jgi:hypothetical protein
MSLGHREGLPPRKPSIIPIPNRDYNQGVRLVSATLSLALRNLGRDLCRIGYRSTKLPTKLPTKFRSRGFSDARLSCIRSPHAHFAAAFSRAWSSKALARAAS